MTCRILLLFILFILSSCVCAGSFVVNVTQSFYQAKENQSITLEWSFPINTGLSLNSMHVFCQKLNHFKAFTLLHVHQGVEVPEFQDEHFAGRVQWDEDVLAEGRVRLHVFRLRTADSGLYICKVVTSYGRNSGKCRLCVSGAGEHETTSSATGSPQPESRARIIFYCALGLVTAALLAFN